MSDIHFQHKHILIISCEPRILVEIKVWLMNYFEVRIAAAVRNALTALETNVIFAIVVYIGEQLNETLPILAEVMELARKDGIPVIFVTENDIDYNEALSYVAGSIWYTIRRSDGAEALVNCINAHSSEWEEPVNHEAILNGRTILVADDIEINREMVSIMFSDIAGLTIEYACDGKEAVQKFEKNPELYSLILMDVQMPEMDGLAATKAIRSCNFENAREIPIVALTAGVDEAETELCFKAGMDDFIKKPIEHKKLIEMVVKYCT